MPDESLLLGALVPLLFFHMFRCVCTQTHTRVIHTRMSHSWTWPLSLLYFRDACVSGEVTGQVSGIDFRWGGD